MVRARRDLRIGFADAKAFQREYLSNLANGGVFVPTETDFELRDPVSVELVLEFCAKSVTLSAEVVHRVTAEMAELSGQAGVAVQFSGNGVELRRQLEPLARTCGIFQFRPVDGGRRAATRVRARVPVRLACGTDTLEGHARDLSVSGALITVPGAPLSTQGLDVGQVVSLTLENPATGETLEVRASVVRKVESLGEVCGLAVQFDPAQEDRENVERFLEEVQNAEHARRIGGIAGHISELGVENLLQMFGNVAPTGTLTLSWGEQEGVVGFEQNTLRYVSLGMITGTKALVRLLGWRNGTFEFHAGLDPVDTADEPAFLEAALFQAMLQRDELARLDLGRIPAHARLRVLAAADVESSGDLGKLEKAVVDLAQAGFTVQRILDVIPEPDLDIYRALVSLTDAGTLDPLT